MKKLSQSGFSHLVLPVILFVIIFGGVGGYVLLHNTKAATAAYVFKSGIPGKCLDDYQQSSANGTTVDLYDCNSSAAQQWNTNTNGTIENANGKCLDNWQQKNTNGNPIKMYTCSGTDPAEQWLTTGNILKNPQTGKCIDDPAYSTTNGKPLELYTCNGGMNQKWTKTAASTGSGTGTGSGSGGSGGSPAPTPSSNSGFITASGTNLMLNGKVFRFIGFDFIPVGDCWSGTNMTTAQMDTFFSLLPKDSVARFTAPEDLTDSPAFVESVVAAADKYGQHVIITLNDSNSDNQCDPLDVDTAPGTGSGKTTAYYTSQAQPGSEYMNWVKSVVTPLKNDPGVAVWEVANEPAHEGSTLYNGLTTAQLDTFLDNAATYVRSLDSNHLISVAPADIGDLGGGVNDNANFETIFKNMDVIDDHDYSWQNDQGEVDAEVPTLEAMSKSLNKPLMIDEAGVPAGTGCTSSTPSCAGGHGLSTSARATYLMTKATDYFNGGVSGIDFWDYTISDNSCDYGMFSTDPMISDVQHYTIP